MMPAGLPPLREVIAAHGLSARKGLGQNFLLDLNLTGKIARAAGPLEGMTVIEVGPGPGGLTRALLDEGAAKVVAIERDQRCIEALRDLAEHAGGRLQLVQGDALKADYAALSQGGKCCIVANLPYNIATPLLTGWLLAEPWPPFYAHMALMFQQEVAERIVARPGSKSYGRLSVLAQWRTSPHIALSVPAAAFTPRPKVNSAIVRFDPIQQPEPCEAKVLERVTAAAFGKRRKMLRSSLKDIHDQPEALLARLGIDATWRAEQLSVAQFCAIARELRP